MIDNIGVEKVAGHRSILRPEVVSRVRSRLDPTRGEAPKAVRMPPRAGGSPMRLRRVWFKDAPVVGPESEKDHSLNPLVSPRLGSLTLSGATAKPRPVPEPLLRGLLR
jgi:hypothetical protein